MYQRILVPVDGSSTSDAGLAEAIRLARGSGGRLRLIHVIDDQSFGFGMAAYGEYPGDWLTVLRDNGMDILEKGQATAKSAGVEVEIKLHDGLLGALDDIVQKEAAQWPADLIVLGTHGRRGVGRLMLGSDAERIVRSSNVPVLLVHGAKPEAGGAAVAAEVKALAGATASTVAALG
ncbi:universal stress protein UspA [Rhodoferax koreense]|uniref:Universal stress protein UspA n=1 Tax=Rhodoferax koreensis TaxID=1842727 RepID=A0A1P8JU70_9BURK|nr:universal stress protein [Rhodoferax koreense]APW37268.1 universal stress protein UspA [Rhodoferax koreense]